MEQSGGAAERTGRGAGGSPGLLCLYIPKLIEDTGDSGRGGGAELTQGSGYVCTMGSTRRRTDTPTVAASTGARATYDPDVLACAKQRAFTAGGTLERLAIMGCILRVLGGSRGESATSMKGKVSWTDTARTRRKDGQETPLPHPKTS